MLRPINTPQPAPAVLDIAGWTAEAAFDRPALFLNDKDRALYHHIFALQAAGRGAEAEPLIASLDDPLLMGHVLYQRYMIDPDHKSDFTELNSWLQDFGDLPNADKVYRLASRRRNTGDAEIVALKMNVSALTRQPSHMLDGFMKAQVRKTAIAPVKTSETQEANAIANRVKADINANEPAKALERFNGQTKLLSGAQQGVLLTQIAMGYYQNGKFSNARQIAQRANRERGNHQLIASWIAGLSAWQMRDYSAAQTYFARVADHHEADSIDPWFYSASAFWAARAAGRQGDQVKRVEYLQKAGTYPTTFYGLLAHGALGRQFQPVKQTATASMNFGRNAIKILTQQPCGERVLALLDIGQKDLATAELQHWLRNQPTMNNSELRSAMLAIASEFKLAGVQQIVAAEQENQNGFLKAVYANDAMFPVLQEAVSTSRNVDPALIHALIRQESKFDPNAKNKSTGASGLMQLMPQTANFMGDKPVDSKALLNPSTNLQLGQRYVDYLLRQPYVAGNLMYLAVAYNAGPGNLQAWQDEIKAKKDPLLFIESLPYGQTRAFVEHVMANYWIYRLRLGQDVPDVQQLVDGAWPQHAKVQQAAIIAEPKTGIKQFLKSVRLQDAKDAASKPTKPALQDAKLVGRFDVALVN